MDFGWEESIPITVALLGIIGTIMTTLIKRKVKHTCNQLDIINFIKEQITKLDAKVDAKFDRLDSKVESKFDKLYDILFNGER